LRNFAQTKQGSSVPCVTQGSGRIPVEKLFRTRSGANRSKSARHLQRAVQPEFELLALVELQVAIGEQSCAATQGASGGRADDRSMWAGDDRSGRRTHGRAHYGAFRDAPAAGAFLRDFAFLAGSFGPVLAGNIAGASPGACRSRQS
jgi:hypothetical protein